VLRSLAVITLGTTAAGAATLVGFVTGITAGGAAGATAGCLMARLRNGRSRREPLSERREAEEEE